MRKEVTDYPNYFISDKWEVASMRMWSWKIMNKTLSDRWYYKVWMFFNWKQKKVRVHRLVAEMFVDNPHNFDEVNHKDLDKLNNHIDNLEWCSREFNRKHWLSAQRRGIKKKRKDKEFREKMSEMRSDLSKKMWQDEWFKEKMKEVRKKNYLEWKGCCHNNKEVYQYSLDGVFIKKYSSAKQAADDNNISYSAWVTGFCRNPDKYTHHKWYKWSYTQYW